MEATYSGRSHYLELCEITFFKLGPAVQKEMSFEDINYLEHMLRTKGHTEGN